MAPEMLFMQPYNSQKVDIYSLGCILYFLMTGNENFNGGFLSSLSAPIDNLKDIVIPDIYSDALRQLMIDCLQMDPDTRPKVDDILARPIMSKNKMSELSFENLSLNFN